MVPALLLLGCTEYEYSERTVTDAFVQEDVETRSDVLFVIDDSSSMSEEQAQLVANFGTFTAVLADSYADFHLGVTTTSPEQGGVLRGGVITPDTPDLEIAVLDALDVGTDGSRDEQGLAMAAAAIDPAVNPGFVREDGRLNLVFVSDEDDHSGGTVQDWMWAYEDVVGADYTVHGIVGDLPEGCASRTSAADAGERYISAAVRTAGYLDSICADDYSALLTHVGLDVAGLTDTFYLSQVPEPDTIEVAVDDVVIPERDPDGWRYDPGTNAIVFDGRAVPRPGMAIAVTYEELMGHAAGEAARVTPVDPGA